MSTNTQFALGVHMLTLLAHAAPESMSSEDMAGSAHANPVQVRRVLGRFRAAGIVASRPGVGGGSHLIQDPSSLTLADVWRVVQGDSHVLGFYEGEPDCPVGRGIHSLLIDIDRRARQAIEDELATTTIAELVHRAESAATLPAVA